VHAAVERALGARVKGTWLREHGPP
jgi:hypothetical protein